MSFLQDEEHENEELWNWLVISQLTAILPWLIFFLYTLFATLLFFDTNPDDFYDEKQSPLTLILLWSGVVFPALSTIISWKSYKQGEIKKAIIWSIFTLLPILLLFLPTILAEY